jgi:hypothetical protein
MGPVTIDGKYAFSVEVTNGGSAPQNDVELWIPFDSTSTGVESLDKSRDFRIEASLPIETRESQDGKFKIVHLSSLAPEESVKISVLMGGHGIYLTEHALVDLRVVSKETAGTLSGPSEEAVLLYKLGSFLLLTLLALVGIWGIYYTYFMDPKKKEEMILQEIDKL